MERRCVLYIAGPFDLETGAFVGNENICMRTYEVKIKENDILILWENE
jgi:nitrite reductase/ring-hydroxylating ferredoxin subunit